jgi:hypothetical protein
VSRARTNIGSIQHDLLRSMGVIRNRIDLLDPEVESAWAELETFCAIAIRVMAKTNPSKLRDVAITVEIQARLNGNKVIESV